MLLHERGKIKLDDPIEKYLDVASISKNINPQVSISRIKQ